MAKKWPGMVVQRTFIKGHSFVYRLYLNFNLQIDKIEAFLALMALKVITMVPHKFLILVDYN
jgi:hypothetical protein